jgi:hypothetical protein
MYVDVQYVRWRAKIVRRRTNMKYTSTYIFVRRRTICTSTYKNCTSTYKIVRRRTILSTLECKPIRRRLTSVALIRILNIHRGIVKNGGLHTIIRFWKKTPVWQQLLSKKLMSVKENMRNYSLYRFPLLISNVIVVFNWNNALFYEIPLRPKFPYPKSFTRVL